MNYTNESFGMMDEGYFVPRTEILSWINNLLRLNISKIQQLGSGSIYCQILDVIYPGKVNLTKVNWKAKNDYEFMNNFRVLQNSFDKLGIKRHVEVEKLSKAKYQDNLEFIQWLKRYYDLNCGERGANYQADERRGGVEPDFSFAEKVIVKHVYNAGNVQTENAIAAKAKKAAELQKKVEKVEKVEKVPEKPPVPTREKSQTVALKPQSANSQPVIRNVSGVVSPKKEVKPPKEAPEVKPMEMEVLPEEELSLTKRIEQLEHMLATERHETESSRNRMQEMMAEQLHAMQQKYAEQTKSLDKRLDSYKEKFEMIADILRGSDAPEEKVKLIEEVVDIGI